MVLKVPDQVKDIAQISRIFYFALHIFGFLVLIIFKSKLQDAITNVDIMELIQMFGKVMIASYFFMVCGDNPGQHYQGPIDKIANIELQTNSFKDGEQSFDEKINEDRANTIFNQVRHGNANDQPNHIIRGQEIIKPLLLDQESDVILHSRIQEETKQIKYQSPKSGNKYISSPKSSSPKSSSSLEVNSGEGEQVNDLPEKRFCNDCLNIQPYRTKHCSSCQRCIPKYDHHCFWIGGCVGELNHRQFWVFLAAQSWVNLSAFLYNLDALDNYYSIDTKSGEETFQRPYFIIFAMAFISFCFTIFTSILCLYHTMLLSVGQTTWEQTKRSSITYLKTYPKYFNPFNFGPIENFKIAFFHNNKLRDWQLPTYDQAKILAVKQFNCFENDFYSCC